MSELDISQLLGDWPLEPGKVNARIISGRDETQKLQVRVELGVLQLELDGRPDGGRPHGRDTYLAYHQRRLERYTTENGGVAGFVLSREDCRDLRQEAVQFYHRYVALLAVAEFARAVRDTSHNLAIFDLSRDFAAHDSDRTMLEQFRPHVVMMRARARAELALKADQPREALRALDHGIEELRAVFVEAGMGDEFEESGEAQVLRGMRDALVPKLPMSQRVELEERLRAAIDAENYELAAILRDELRML